MKILRVLHKEGNTEELLAFFKGLELDVISNSPSVKGERSIEVIIGEEYIEYIVFHLKKHFGPGKMKVFTQDTSIDFGRINRGINPEKYKILLNNEKTDTLFNRKSLSAIDIAVREGLCNINYYYAMVILSSIVAGAGLIGDSPAVIIGSMVIAPLLGPNVALAFSISIGDIELFKKSIKLFSFGVFIAIVSGLFQGLIIPFEENTHELLSRTNIGFLDLLLAFCSGIAGVLSLTVGVNATLVGVMIAVALMPPLISFGILLGRGDSILALSAFLLFLANVIVINLAGILTFRLERVEPKEYFQQQVTRAKAKRLIRIWVIGLLIISIIIFFKNN